MSGYTKLFSSIVRSTIWRASDHTRLVWVTMLAIADRDGVIESSVPGLADLARVPIESCRAALQELMQPDPDSRSVEDEGRRIRPIDGGWQLVNHAKYRERMNEEDRRTYKAEKMRQYRSEAGRGGGVWRQPSANPHGREGLLCNGLMQRRHGNHAWCSPAHRPGLCVTQAIDEELRARTLLSREDQHQFYARTFEALGDRRLTMDVPNFWRQACTHFLMDLEREKPVVVDEVFEAIWDAYPANRRGSRERAEASWADLSPQMRTTEAPKILAALRWQTTSEEWRKRSGKFVPLLPNYIHDRAWTAAPPTKTAAVSSAKQWTPPTTTRAIGGRKA